MGSIVKRRHVMRITLLLALLFLAITTGTSPAFGQASSVPAEYQQVLTTLGKQGDFKDNVLKVNIPRNDVKVTVAGVATPTPFGFGGWIAMTKGDCGHQVLMGDLVLLQDEVNPVNRGCSTCTSTGTATPRILPAG